MTNILRRASGVLLHPTSLPGPYAIGDLGSEARTFVDFLAESGQTLWQILPLNPTGYGNSPYNSLSAFAGNTLLISLELLVNENLLSPDDLLAACDSKSDEQVDYEAARAFKDRLLQKAFVNFQRTGSSDLRAAFGEFCERAAFWLDDYALFQALKTSQGNIEWPRWESDLSQRTASALEGAHAGVHEEIVAQKFFQFLFFRQWKALHDYCRERSINVIGDVPIFVAHDSADVWSHRDYFKLDEQGNPSDVAGVPPDYFSETGQLWGNPLYDWERLKVDGFKWWIARVRWALEQFDFIRIDHFRGFAACWEVPAGEKTAERGQWVPTPGKELFAALKTALGDLPIIAENLGVITPDVEELRRDFGFPGMRVLQFAFSCDAMNDHLPHNYARDTVVYTGTHDNDTTVGWFTKLTEGQNTRSERESCLRYLNSEGREIHWDLIRAALASVAETAINPLQDLLGLGTEARMNLPASESDNWLWRYRAGALSETVATRLREMTTLYGRANQMTE